MNNTSAPFIPEELRQYLTPTARSICPKSAMSARLPTFPTANTSPSSRGRRAGSQPELRAAVVLAAVAFTILEGKHKELDIRQWWSLEVLPPKEGKEGVWAPDIARMKQAAAAVGAPIAHFHAFEPEKARRELAQALGRKTLDISVKSRSYTPKGTTEKKSRKEVVVLVSIRRRLAVAPQPKWPTFRRWRKRRFRSKSRKLPRRYSAQRSPLRCPSKT